MDERRIVQHVQHKFFPIDVVLIQDVLGTSHTLVKSTTIEDRSLEVPDIPSEVVGQLPDLGSWQFRRVFVGWCVMTEGVMKERNV